MTGLRDALQWSGKPVISLFVVAPKGASRQIDVTGLEGVTSVRRYALEDESRVLGDMETYEYDLTMEALPDSMEGVLEELLRRACRAGGRVAWLGLEGSFDFQHILTADVAEQIYGVCVDETELEVALDNEARTASAWREQLAAARRALLE